MLAINLSDTLKAKLKATSIHHGKPVGDMAAEALEYWLEVEEWAACRASKHEPNEETIKAIDECLRGDKRKA